MNPRKIAGRSVPLVGLGAMAVDEYEPAAGEDEAVALFRHAAKTGVGLFDTADVYGLGRNETLIGKALTEEQKRGVLVATKAGCTRPGGVGWDTDGRPDHIREAVRGSLARLGVKRIELYQLHAPDHRVPLRESMLAMRELQEEGLVKHIGVSNFSLAQLKEAQRLVDVVSVQNRYNIAFRRDERELLPYLTEHSIPYLPYFPLGSGQLLNQPAVRRIAERERITAAQLALAWILAKWPTAIPIPGTRSIKHLEENMKAGEVTLSERVVREIDGLY